MTVKTELKTERSLLITTLQFADCKNPEPGSSPLRIFAGVHTPARPVAKPIVKEDGMTVKTKVKAGRIKMNHSVSVR